MMKLPPVVPNEPFPTFIELQLTEKIGKLNNNANNLLNEKIDLKPDELTLANILENNYTFEDIDNKLTKNYLLNNFNNIDNLDIINSKILKKEENLDDLLFE